jgi:hypothetical protein
VGRCGPLPVVRELSFAWLIVLFVRLVLVFLPLIRRLTTLLMAGLVLLLLLAPVGLILLLIALVFFLRVHL